MLRIPAIALGFIYFWEWEQYLEKHEKDFSWEPGGAAAICESYEYDEYSKWLSGEEGYDPWQMPNLNLYPDIVKAVPGSFLDYYLEETKPLPYEENTYHENECVRPLTEEEKEKYLPLYQKAFSRFYIGKHGRRALLPL